jgi:hypothetical protein
MALFPKIPSISAPIQLGTKTKSTPQKAKERAHFSAVVAEKGGEDQSCQQHKITKTLKHKHRKQADEETTIPYNSPASSSSSNPPPPPPEFSASSSTSNPRFCCFLFFFFSNSSSWLRRC